MVNEVRKLPLWKGLLEQIEREGIKYGNTYRAEYFEKELSCRRDSREFGLAVHKIRVALERKGFYLQGHALKKKPNRESAIPPGRNIGPENIIHESTCFRTNPHVSECFIFFNNKFVLT